MRKILSNRPVLILVAALVVLAVIWVVFACFVAPALIAKAYRGESLTIFNRMITGQADHALAEYLVDWKHSATRASVGLSLLAGLIPIPTWANLGGRRGTARAPGALQGIGSSASESSNLDFLRAIAVLAVFTRHLMLTMGRSPKWGPLGVYGVLLFFVHTSLVLMMSLERIELSAHPLFRTFYIRRFFRIYPLSIACVAIIVLFHLPLAPRENWTHPDSSTILANLLLCQNLFYKTNLSGVLWTLPLEVQMYILLPVFYLVGKRYHIRGIMVLWLGAVVVATTQLLIPDRLASLHIGARMDIATYVPCFLAGVASYFIGFGVIRRRFSFIGWPVAIAAGGFAFLYATSHGYRRAGMWLTCLFIGLTAPLFADLKMPLLRKSAAWIARYSYGIYLVHLYALWAGIDVMSQQVRWIRSLVVLALAIGLPVLLYHLLESPMIRLGGFLADRWTVGISGDNSSRSRPHLFSDLWSRGL
jgi:peptidoglycan/LPS O-acetylase OafA/YrhL